MTAASSKGGPLLRLQFPLGEIPTLALRYSYGQDEQVIKLGELARDSGYFTRPAFLAVCAWKTERSKSRVARNSAEDVEEATRMALAANSEALRIQIPQALFGVSSATASVLLHLPHRDRYPILDYRALEALGVTGNIEVCCPSLRSERTQIIGRACGGRSALARRRVERQTTLRWARETAIAGYPARFRTRRRAHHGEARERAQRSHSAPDCRPSRHHSRF